MTRDQNSIPRGLCQCGCGQATRPATQNSARFGWVKGEPVMYVASHGARGRWADQYTVRDCGYFTPCHIWRGCSNLDTYGQVRRERVAYVAHVWVWMSTNGPVPEGLQLDHLCRVPACVNPEHLEPVTPRENVLRSNNPAAINARKTHCKYGHPLSGGNIKMYGRRRKCLICEKVYSRRSYLRKAGKL